MPNLDESTGVITTTEVPKKPLINYGESLLQNGGKKGVLARMTSSGWTVETMDKNSQFRGVLADHSNPYLVGMGWNGQTESPEVGIAVRRIQDEWKIQWIPDSYTLSGIAQSTPGHSIAVGRFKTGYRDFERSYGIMIDERSNILWKGDLYRHLSDDLDSGALKITVEYHAWRASLGAFVFLGLFLLYRHRKSGTLQNSWSWLLSRVNWSPVAGRR